MFAKVLYFILFIALVQSASTNCIRLESSCLGGTKTIFQINNSTNYYSFYVDEITNVYSGTSCSDSDITHQIITHRTYDTTYCMGTAESIYYKVIDSNNLKQNAIVQNCGSSLTKKFVDISTLNCKVDGADPFYNLRSTLNTQRYACIKFNQSQPEIIGTSASEESCVSEYDMGSSWYKDFMMVMYIILGVLAVCVVICVIFVVVKPKKKAMKKTSAV